MDIPKRRSKGDMLGDGDEGLPLSKSLDLKSISVSPDDGAVRRMSHDHSCKVCYSEVIVSYQWELLATGSAGGRRAGGFGSLCESAAPLSMPNVLVADIPDQCSELSGQFLFDILEEDNLPMAAVSGIQIHEAMHRDKCLVLHPSFSRDQEQFLDLEVFAKAINPGKTCFISCIIHFLPGTRIEQIRMPLSLVGALDSLKIANASGVEAVDYTSPVTHSYVSLRSVDPIIGGYRRIETQSNIFNVPSASQDSLDEVKQWTLEILVQVTSGVVLPDDEDFEEIDADEILSAEKESFKSGLKNVSSFTDFCNMDMLSGVGKLSDPVAAQRRNDMWKSTEIPSLIDNPPTKLKNLIRYGVPDLLRRAVWKACCGFDLYVKPKETAEKVYRKFYQRAFGFREWGFSSDFENYVPAVVPDFGGVLRFEQHCLNRKGINAARRVLCVLAETFPILMFCPPLPDVVCILLLYVTEAEAFICGYGLIEKSLSEKSRYWFFRTTKKSRSVMMRTCEGLVEKRIPELFTFYRALDLSLCKSIAPIFDRIFFSFVPLQLSLRIFDSFLAEGSKILHRYSLALQRIHMDKIMEVVSSQRSMERFMLFEMGFLDVHMDALSKAAFKILLQRSVLNEFDERNQDLVEASDLAEAPVTRKYAAPKHPMSSRILTGEQYEILWSWFPDRLHIRRPEKVYSTDVDGYSIQTLYHRCRNIDENLLVIEAIPKRIGRQSLQLSPGKAKAHVCVFGALCFRGWKISPTFYGIGSDMFLFTFHPEAKKYVWSHQKSDDEKRRPPATKASSPTLTGRNTYFQLAKPDAIIIGGGGYVLRPLLSTERTHTFFIRAI
jgi:hypothetical protein